MPKTTAYYVYVVFRLNGVPCYVGKGKNYRYYDTIKRSTNRHLRNIIRQAGGALPLVIVRDDLSESEAFGTERALISAIGRADLGKGPLVNHTDGGEGSSGRIVSEAERNRMRGNTYTLGKKHTAETRAKMSESQKKREHNPEHVRKAQEARRGTKTSDETREKQRVAAKLRSPPSQLTIQKRAAKLRGLKRSPEVIERMRQVRLGKKLSVEHRENLKKSHLGKKQSEETRAKMSAKHLERQREFGPEKRREIALRTWESRRENMENGSNE